MDPFLQLSEEARVHHVGHVTVANLSPLQFYRQFVAQSQPVILTDLCDDWPAVHRWSCDYLRAALGCHEVSVNVTPEGLGDAVIDNQFVKPEERRMPFSRYLDLLEGRAPAHGVFYVSHQNNSFATEFASLHGDISQTVQQWGEEVFGVQADAVNLWLGDDHAVSSMHKDHYENLYVVVRGEKHFTLLPPWDSHFTHTRPYPPARFSEDTTGSFRVVPEEGPMVPWMPVDPDCPDLQQFPKFAFAQPLHVVVKAGEVLYLPALWYHKVAQRGDSEGKTVAVNYWFDMEYGPMYHYFQLVDGLANKHSDEHEDK
eukprot:GGOE01040589.1.p1 GENE.GGOE01040589.1~~GGOE01040589.1.p1  ORF type:complete len:341 (-),score=73.42 GGOE01040589.1:53-991(-)